MKKGALQHPKKQEKKKLKTNSSPSYFENDFNSTFHRTVILIQSTNPISRSKD